MVQSEPGKPGKVRELFLKICTGQGKIFYDCKKCLVLIQ